VLCGAADDAAAATDVGYAAADVDHAVYVTGEPGASGGTDADREAAADDAAAGHAVDESGQRDSGLAWGNQ
jgi:hypothetical protein